MSTDRPPHDDKFLAELAAFEELLRKPLEDTPRPAAPLASPASQASPASLPNARRAVAVPPSSARPLRSRAGTLSVAALIAGVVAGGPLGWWLATKLFVPAPTTEHAARAASTTEPANARPVASRPSTRRSTSNTSSPSVAPSATPNVAAPTAAGISATSIAPAPSIELPSGNPPSTDLAAADLLLAAARPAGAPLAVPLPSAPVEAVPSMPPAAPPSVAAADAVAAVAADERAIATTLRQYKDAYERLDAKAAVAVWPTVDRRALSRAFAGLASQSIDFRGCDVVVRAGASTATASCSGTAEYVRKVGDARVRVEPRQWTFTLNKTQGAWRIEAVDGSR